MQSVGYGEGGEGAYVQRRSVDRTSAKRPSSDTAAAAATAAHATTNATGHLSDGDVSCKLWFDGFNWGSAKSKEPRLIQQPAI